MSNIFNNIIERHSHPEKSVKPRTPGYFEPTREGSAVAFTAQTYQLPPTPPPLGELEIKNKPPQWSAVHRPAAKKRLHLNLVPPASTAHQPVTEVNVEQPPPTVSQQLPKRAHPHTAPSLPPVSPSEYPPPSAALFELPTSQPTIRDTIRPAEKPSPDSKPVPIPPIRNPRIPKTNDILLPRTPRLSIPGSVPNRSKPVRQNDFSLPPITPDQPVSVSSVFEIRNPKHSEKVNTPTIRININRIEIRRPPPSSKPEKRRSAKSKAPKVSLDQFLKQRDNKPS